MAYLIITADGQELDRRELTGPATLGRSPDCDVSVHDILLSRTHCRLEPTPDGWVLTDLASKNGTLVAGQRITSHPLNDGDVFTVGRSKLTFHSGSFIPGPRKLTPTGPSPRRPADPHEALAGTVAGFVLSDPPPVPAVKHIARRMPNPKPRPADPASFAADDIYSMLEEIASSSWDSIYANASRPTRKPEELPRPIVKSADEVAAATPKRAVRPIVGGGPAERLNGRFPHADVNFDLQVAERPELPTLTTVGPLTAPQVSSPRRPRFETIARRAVCRFTRMSRWMTRVGLARLF